MPHRREGGDRTLLTVAENGFRTYLKANPNGAYATSARGLLRRVYRTRRRWGHGRRGHRLVDAMQGHRVKSVEPLAQALGHVLPERTRTRGRTRTCANGLRQQTDQG